VYETEAAQRPGVVRKQRRQAITLKLLPSSKATKCMTDRAR
jgi:hypothetical protein